MRWLFMALLTTAAALAAGQNAPLPDGDGKALVNSACVSCHGLDLITGKQGTRDEWAASVDRMKTYGVNLDAKQTTTIIDYLAKSFPPKGAAPAPAPAPTPAPAAAPQDEAAANAAGKAAMDQLCVGCHGLDLITSKQANRVDWQSAIDRMKSYGASIDDKQNAILIEYLVRNHGPKQQAAATPAAADPGKAIFEGFCGGCHDLDLSTNRTGTQQDWQDIVDRMNGRGAGVAEKDVPVLVAYLAKTYPVKK